MRLLEDPTHEGAHRRPRDSWRRSRKDWAWGPGDVRSGSGTLAQVGEPRSPQLELVAAGLDHTTAGVELRERVAFAPVEIRAALEHALAAGTAGPELRRLFESAIAAGRRIRASTALGRGVASVPQASVEFVRQRLGTLSRSTVLLIGAGTMGELAAKHLVKRQAGTVLILGRDVTRAERLAEQQGGRA